MSNPGEYHTMMFEFFWNGNTPVQRVDRTGKPTSTSLVPKKAMAEFEEMMKAQQDPERQAQRQAALQREAERQAAVEAARVVARGDATPD